MAPFVWDSERHLLDSLFLGVGIPLFNQEAGGLVAKQLIDLSVVKPGISMCVDRSQRSATSRRADS
jgi:hypothetical protein